MSVYARPKYDGKRHYSLSRMNRNSADVCRPGRAGHQQAVGLVLKMGMPVGIVDVLHNFRGIEQDHNVVGQKNNRVDAKFLF